MRGGVASEKEALLLGKYKLKKKRLLAGQTLHLIEEKKFVLPNLE